MEHGAGPHAQRVIDAVGFSDMAPVARLAVLAEGDVIQRLVLLHDVALVPRDAAGGGVLGGELPRVLRLLKRQVNGCPRRRAVFPEQANAAARNVETIVGGFGNARLSTSGSGAVTLFGEFGDDVLSASTGADTFDGGAGTDTVTYAASKSGVTIDLSVSPGFALGGHAAGDKFVSVETIIGSDFADRINGGRIPLFGTPA